MEKQEEKTDRGWLMLYEKKKGEKQGSLSIDGRAYDISEATENSSGITHFVFKRIK
jgi:hypothetical protein